MWVRVMGWGLVWRLLGSGVGEGSDVSFGCCGMGVGEGLAGGMGVVSTVLCETYGGEEALAHAGDAGWDLGARCCGEGREGGGGCGCGGEVRGAEGRDLSAGSFGGAEAVVRVAAGLSIRGADER